MSLPLRKFDLRGKTALITGAGGLLGVQHAAALLESGCNVVLTDVRTEVVQQASSRLASEFGAERIHVRNMDVSDLSSIRSVEQSLRVAGRRIDILLNNAAIDPKVSADSTIREASRLEHFTRAEWDTQLAVGLTGAFLCSQVFGSAMASDERGGVILNIASDLSVISPDQRLYRRDGVDHSLQPVKPVTSSVIKAGLVGLTLYLSTDWAEYGVRCNALSPGGVFNGQGHEFVQRLTSLIPLGRMAEIDEYRAAVQFLCSDASSYMNGQNIVMDGGRSVW